VAGPLPGFRSKGGQKTQGGGTFFKYNIGCMQQPGAKHEMGASDTMQQPGAKHEMGASDTTGPPLATTLECGQIHRCLFR